MRKLVAVCCALPAVALAVPAIADVALAPQLLTPGTVNDLFLNSATADGTRVYFNTDEKLEAADGDASADVYERVLATGVTRLMTDRVQPGADAEVDAGMGGVSADGARFVFGTDEQILDADDDASSDLYEVTSGGVSLISGRVKDATVAEEDVYGGGMSADGTKIFFLTAESLVNEDGDTVRDLYLRTGGVTKLISDRVQGGTDEMTHVSQGRSTPDSSRILFTTNEQVVDADNDTVGDLYLYDVATSTTTLVSDRVQAGDDATAADDAVDSVHGISPDGSRVYFATQEPIMAQDTDGPWDDVYEYRVSDGVTTMISDRVQAGNDAPNHAGVPSSLAWPTSTDGSHVVFVTSENLVAEDGDSEAGFFFDTYERFNGTTKLVSDRVQAGTDANQSAFPHAISRDGARIVFVSFEPILAEDLDSAQDVYLRQGATTTTMLSDRVPAGTTVGANISTARANLDVTRVFFFTSDPLVAEDGDSSGDIYERAVDAGVTTLLTDRAKAGPDEAQTVQSVVYADDGARVFFSHNEQLVDADGDTARDVYLANTPPLPDPEPSPTPSPDPTTEPTVVPTAAPTTTPVATVTPVPTVTPPPALKPADVVTLPSARKCVSRRRFRIKLLKPRGTTITQATVFINGKKKKTFRGTAIKPTVDLRGLPKGKITVKIEIKTADGRTAKLTRRYRTCAPGKR